MNNKKTLASFIVIIGISGLLLIGSLTKGHDWGGDFAGYIMQAASLANGSPGEFIEANRFAVEQSSITIGPVAYPWGYPLLLAPFYAEFGLDMIALKMAGVISYLLLLILLWRGFGRIHAPLWLLCLVALFAFNPTMLTFSDNILSDLPFLLFSTLGVVLIGVVIVDRRRIVSPLWDSVLLGAVITAAFFIRTNGLLLIAPLVIAQLVSAVRRKGGERRTFVFLVPYAVFVLAAVVWELALPKGGASHLSLLKDVSGQSILSNINYYLRKPAAFFSGVPEYRIVYVVSLPIAIAGAVRRIRSDYTVVVYVAATVMLYVIWPYHQGLRFVFPVLPFYISFMISGLEMLQGGRITKKMSPRKLVCYIPVIIIIFMLSFDSARSAYANIKRDRETPTGPYTKTAEDMFSFIRENTNNQSTIIFFKPRVMRMMTGRGSILINKAEHLDRGDYLCYYSGGGAHDQASADEIDELLRAGTARLIYESVDFKIISLEDISAAAGSGSAVAPSEPCSDLLTR
jgi:hypothetical protein